MQILSAYQFEVAGLDAGESGALLNQIGGVVESWLRSKGATSTDVESGSFVSKTKGAPDGSFQRRVSRGTSGTLHEIHLQEPTFNGQTFITSISWLSSENKVSVYSTLTVMNSSASVAPIFTDPKCPSVVRNIISLRSDWSFGGYPLAPPTPSLLSGNEAGRKLADKILDPHRTLPVLVVSEIEDQPLWEGLEDSLAFDLSGLAQVVRIDELASWGLTDEIGKLYSCYQGAVRLYWPSSTGSDEHTVPRNTVWTAAHMLSLDDDGKGSNRFRAAIRRSVMSVASLAVEPPTEIRSILNQVSRERLRELEDRANSNSEELELARLFIEENEQLKEQLEAARRESARLAARAETAEHALSQVSSQPESPSSGGSIEGDSPAPGEVRYYKKVRNTPSHDVMVLIKNCGHSSWQSAAKADKAKKGVEKLEGRANWEGFYHCGKCSGGGVWKVIW